MKLHSPQFQKRLRRGVKKNIRKSRELKKEYRQAKKFRKHINIGWLFRAALSFGFGAGVMAVVRATGHPVTGLAMIALWSLVWVFFHAESLWMFLHSHLDILALRLLPVSDAAIFWWQLQKFFRRVIFSFLDLLAGFGAVGLFLKLSTAQWLVVPLIIALSWGTLLALAALCAIHIPRKKRQMMTFAIYLSGFVLFYAVKMDGGAVLGWLDRIAPDLNWMLPTGWPVTLFQLLLPDSPPTAIFSMAPVAFLLWSLKSSFARLRNDFRFEEHVLPMIPDIVPAMNPKESAIAGSAPQPAQNLGLSAIEEIVQSRRFLEPVPWPQRGWFEKQLWNWFDCRERVLSEFAFPKGYAITVPWRNALRNLAVAMAAAFTLGLVDPTLKNWIMGTGLFVTVCQALAQILGCGVAFRPMFCSGVNIPIYAGYGIGYRELSRLLLKYSAVQLPLFIPFITFCGVLTTSLLKLSWQMGLVIGFKAGILMFAGRFIFIMFSFSGGTNDSSRFRIRTLIQIILVMGLGTTFLGLGAASLFVPNAPVAWGMLMLSVLMAYGMFTTYGWFYRANRFDLMSIPRR